MEANINARVFKTILLLLATLTIVSVKANPLMHYNRDRDTRPERNETPGGDVKKDPYIDHYDQRQNGTENYRVKVDGLVFILAPADTLLLGAAMEPNFTSLFSDINKPKPKPEKEDLFQPSKFEKENILKSANIEAPGNHGGHKPALRISNLIAPFLSRIRHTQQPTK